MEHRWAYEWVAFDFVLEVGVGFGSTEKAEERVPRQESSMIKTRSQDVQDVFGE